MITVACTKRDPKCFNVQKYDVEAGKMLAAGTVRVVIGSAEWRL